VEADELKDAEAPAIRPADVADLEQVFALAMEFATSFRPNMEAFRGSFRRILEHPNALLLVAVESGLIKGYLLGFDHEALFANGLVAWIEELIVDQKRRRNRIGTRLVERFEDWARSRGSKLVALGTRRADSFYRAIGYEESATYYRKLL